MILHLPVRHTEAKGADFEGRCTVIHPHSHKVSFPFSLPHCINPVLFTRALNNAWCRTTPQSPPPHHHHPKAFHYINLLQVGATAALWQHPSQRGTRNVAPDVSQVEHPPPHHHHLKYDWFQMAFSKH